MPGQISIRLSSKTIDQLNRLAKKSGRRRAELLRDIIESGIANHAKKTPKPEVILQSFRDEIMTELNALSSKVTAHLERLSATSNDTKPESRMPHATPAREPPPSHTAADASSHQSSASPELLPAGDPAGENADPILVASRAKDSSRGHLGGKSKKSAGQEKPIPEPAATNVLLPEQSIGRRLDVARRRLGYSIKKVSEELNLKNPLTQEILKGNRKVPPSRALRVEAKLQQWESMSRPVLEE